MASGLRPDSRRPPGVQLHSVAARFGPALAWRQAVGRAIVAGLPAEQEAVETAIAHPPAPGARSEHVGQLEAVLFLAREPLASRKLAQLAGLADGTEARTLVRFLNRLYDAEGCAFRVEEVAGGFQLLTRPKFAPWLRRLHGEAAEVRLSSPALETLAVVAYRQPVLRAEIEAIRGVQCGEILRQLMERDLVRIVGRSEELGRPFLYGTTRYFLQVFGLRHLDDLPRPDLFTQRPPGEGSAGSLTPPASGSDMDMSNDQPLLCVTPQEAEVKALVTPQEFPTTVGEEELLPVAEILAAEDEDDDFESDEEEYEDEEEFDDDEEEEELEEEEEELEGDWEEVEDEDGEEEEEEEEEWEDEDEEWDDDDEEWDDEEGDEEEEEWEEEEE